MLQFNKLTFNFLINKRKIELRNINEEKQDRKRTRTEWQKMSSRRLMIDREEKMT